VRPFISDGIHERFSLQFMEQKDQGLRNIISNVMVNNAQLALVRTEGGFDVASVCVVASAIDIDQSLTNGARLRGSGGMEQFVEFWSFVRRRGSQSVAGKSGLIEGHCPNCGAAVELNAGAKCANCQALLRDGQYDWVLAEITQESEWPPTRAAGMPGVSELRERDPEFSLADLEDRASVMFWRKAMAERLNSLDPVRKIAAPEALESFAARSRAQPQAERVFTGDRAVGSVQTLGVLPPKGPYERALIQVRWEGQDFLVMHGQRPTPRGPRQRHTSMLTLARRPGVLTDPGHGLSSAHCPKCGGPVTIDTANACEFCGAVCNDGSGGWVLLDFASPAPLGGGNTEF
jgi:endogenous inhibitor of DNA gyrase (YacG/DUF329 family)